MKISLLKCFSFLTVFASLNVLGDSCPPVSSLHPEGASKRNPLLTIPGGVDSGGRHFVGSKPGSLVSYDFYKSGVSYDVWIGTSKVVCEYLYKQQIYIPLYSLSPVMPVGENWTSRGDGTYQCYTNGNPSSCQYKAK